jgi:hypothetical protein
LGACGGTQQDTAVPEKETLSAGEPTIHTFEWACDVETATWSFEVETENWSHSASVALAIDETYLETHTLRSRGAAADGTSDTLKVEIDIVADWQDASSGSSTAFLCTAANLESLNGRLYAYALPEGTLADCANFGVESDVLDSFDLDTCDVTYEDAEAESAR